MSKCAAAGNVSVEKERTDERGLVRERKEEGTRKKGVVS